MNLGVPAYRRYDLLEQLLASAESGTRKPDRYIIVDNGGLAGSRRLPENTELVTPGRNLGVAASWNAIIERSGDAPVAIVNDDVVLAADTLELLLRAVTAGARPIAMAEGFAAFAITKACVDTVGWFDENFYPAYFEDVDYHYRMRVRGVAAPKVATVAKHHGSATSRSLSAAERGKLSESVSKNRIYYAGKWGGVPGKEKFTVPFNGSHPQGWQLRKS